MECTYLCTCAYVLMSLKSSLLALAKATFGFMFFLSFEVVSFAWMNDGYAMNKVIWNEMRLTSVCRDRIRVGLELEP